MEFSEMETAMPTKFLNPTGRAAIAERIAERQRRSNDCGDLIMLGERDLPDAPFSKAEARTEALKWFWQH
jgi:hypothetical protein